MKIQGWMQRPQICFRALLVACAFGLTPAAKADPIMTVTFTNYLGMNTLGQTRIIFEYNFQNISSLADANNMIGASLNAPSSQSLFFLTHTADAPRYFYDAATPPSSYGYNALTNALTFTSMLVTPNASDSSDWLTIMLFAPTNAIISHTGYATATASGTAMNPSPPFNQVNNLDVPMLAIPEPGALGFGVLAVGLTFLCRHRFRAARRSS